MTSVNEAQQLVLANCRPMPVEATPLAEAVGRVLAEAAAASGDLPPYDKSMMDGYALRAADLVGDSAEFEVLEVIGAGSVPTREVGRGAASRIMTGAPLPSGADCVVVVERSQAVVGAEPNVERVRLSGPIFSGENVMPRGGVVAAGAQVLPRGVKLAAPQIALLAEVGVARPQTHRRPKLAVLATGDELVPPEEAPGPAQIRNSNGPLLVSAAASAGAETQDLGIVRDDESALRAAVEQALRCDVVVLTGGVSAGMFDLVPKVLAGCGVRQVFHKVDLKPGKPIWFGVREGATHTTLVFGLPGNPVSTLVCFELFVRPALRLLQGTPQDDAVPDLIPVRLAVAHSVRGDRPTYYPSRLSLTPEGIAATPLPWKGSSDQTVLATANGLVLFLVAGDYALGAEVSAAPLPGAWDA